MRQFRGLTKDGVWVYGCLIKHGFREQYRIITKKDAIFVKYEDMLQVMSYEVIPKTVGQYTGLKDKNGKEIYKGDCFRTSNKHGYSSNCIAEVLFMDGAFVIQLYRSDDMEIAPELILDFKRSFQDSFEIIGDIHTTPNLLENPK